MIEKMAGLLQSGLRCAKINIRYKVCFSQKKGACGKTRYLKEVTDPKALHSVIYFANMEKRSRMTSSEKGL